MSNTPNYNWVLPSVGGDTDTWGTKANAAFTAADATVKANADTAAAATAAALQAADNLSDLASVATALTNLGLVITTNGNGSYMPVGPLLLQWGSAVGDGSSRALPKAFSSTTGAQIFAGNTDAQGANVDNAYAYISDAGHYVFSTKASTGANNSGKPGSWFAVGPA